MYLLSEWIVLYNSISYEFCRIWKENVEMMPYLTKKKQIAKIHNLACNILFLKICFKKLRS